MPYSCFIPHIKEKRKVYDDVTKEILKCLFINLLVLKFTLFTTFLDFKV